MKHYLIAFGVTYFINLIGVSIIVYFELFKFESFIMGALLMAQTIKLSEYIHSLNKTEQEKINNQKTK